MKKERQLYDKFVDVLSDILEAEPTPQQLKIVREFLADNNITALQDRHEALGALADKNNKLPFDDEDFEDLE